MSESSMLSLTQYNSPIQYAAECICDKELDETFDHLKKIENLDISEPNINFIKNMETKGRNLYKTIPELRDISTVMEHPEFYGFYYKYMKDLNKFKRMIVLMKIYDVISHRLHQKDPAERFHNSYHKLVLLYNIIKSPYYSKIILGKIPAQICERQQFMSNDASDKVQVLREDE